MITKVANKITDSLVGYNVITVKNRIASEYGMEMLIAYTLNIISAAVIGFALDLPLELTFMLVAFIKLRGYNGGVHAPNHILCYILSMITIFASLKLLLWAISIPIHPYYLALLIFPFCGMMFLLSPVEDYNKPLDELEKNVYRKRGLAVLSVTLAVFLALIMLGLTSLGYAVGMAIIITSTSMLIGYIKNRIIDMTEKY